MCNYKIVSFVWIRVVQPSWGFQPHLGKYLAAAAENVVSILDTDSNLSALVAGKLVNVDYKKYKRNSKELTGNKKKKRKSKSLTVCTS